MCQPDINNWAQDKHDYSFKKAELIQNTADMNYN